MEPAAGQGDGGAAISGSAPGAGGYGGWVDGPEKGTCYSMPHAKLADRGTGAEDWPSAGVTPRSKVLKLPAARGSAFVAARTPRRRIRIVCGCPAGQWHIEPGHISGIVGRTPQCCSRAGRAILGVDGGGNADF